MKLTKVKGLIKRLHIAPSADMYEKTLRDILRAQEDSKRKPSAQYKPNMWRIVVGSRAGGLAAACLIILAWVAVLIQSREVTNLRNELELAKRDVAIARTDDSATINLYLREHQDFIARTASLSLATPQPVQMHIDQDDILYYEFLDDGPEFMHPGIIVRGPSTQRQINSPEAPVISNGYTLTLSEARKTADFDLLTPSWLDPGYTLDQIRRIEGRDAMQLLYTDGINSVSLFEQSLDGQRGLSRQDFREYAVYRNTEQAGGTILAWRDGARSYVLIGNTELSQLMSMAQSISATK
ncbi:MAG: hypothetical protein ACYTFW_18460 [Planctomycetota bacterium]|jgi:hypothetical protein